MKEDVMKYFPVLMLAGTLAVASPAVANHIGHLDTPFPTRGGCEAETSALSNDDDWLLDAFPDVFSSEGEVRSFLNKAFTCEINQSDGNFYITDHRVEVLNSEWFAQRNH
jgi:histidinol-phosphate/aromatic aminotransferase/cobyric acid decarboxylase-like protein